MRTRTFARRHPTLGALGLACAVVLGGLSAWWSFQPAYLEVSSPTRGATIFVDGVARGVTYETPVRIEVSDGIHIVRLEKPSEDLAGAEEEVVARRGYTRSIERVIPSRKGVVYFKSDPPGARVSLRAERTGSVDIGSVVTPATVTSSPVATSPVSSSTASEPREQECIVQPAGAGTDCRAVWKRGALRLEGSEQGIQVEVFAGDRAGRAPPVATATLPRDPLQLPEGVYSLPARLRGLDRRVIEGPKSVSLKADATTTARI